MSQIETKQPGRAVWSALPSVMLAFGLVLNVAWLGALAWGLFQLAEWALS